MSVTRVRVENLAKQYRLGEVGTGTLSHDLNRFWHKLRGKEDPYTLVTENNDRTRESSNAYVWAIEDINFDVKEGEVLGIIGRNGAGKSTLLKILSKVTGPTKGEIKLNGRIGSLLEVGTGMHPDLTGKENIYLNGAILGMTKNEIARKFDEIVEFAGIAKYINTPFKRYSSGMRVRLGFAVAAFLEPEILIVDEVLAVGDAEFQKKAIGKMKEVSAEGDRTVLFVSHNMGSIKSLCDRCILLDKGKIVFDGETDACIREYMRLNNQESDTLLLERKERTGNGNLRFSGVRLFNAQNEEVSEVFSGEPLKIHLNFVLRQKVDTERIILAFGIHNGHNEAVLSMVTDEMGIVFPKTDQTKGYFVIDLPALMLRAGGYSFRLLAMEGDTNPESFLDEISNAFQLDVISSDYWESGKTIRPAEMAFCDGKITMEHEKD